ncbi:hypothetical protein J6590_003550 [Homalodisca vitripennis]|nr:hypothetical protein J6590_003550 [Homalodisca vitripennis]
MPRCQAPPYRVQRSLNKTYCMKIVPLGKSDESKFTEAVRERCTFEQKSPYAQKRQRPFHLYPYWCHYHQSCSIVPPVAALRSPLVTHATTLDMYMRLWEGLLLSIRLHLHGCGISM